MAKSGKYTRHTGGIQKPGRPPLNQYFPVLILGEDGRGMSTTIRGYSIPASKIWVAESPDDLLTRLDRNNGQTIVFIEADPAKRQALVDQIEATRGHDRGRIFACASWEMFTDKLEEILTDYRNTSKGVPSRPLLPRQEVTVPSGPPGPHGHQVAAAST